MVQKALRLTVIHRGSIHKHQTEPAEGYRLTVALRLRKALQCTCHWFMDGRVSYRINGKMSECNVFKTSWPSKLTRFSLSR